MQDVKLLQSRIDECENTRGNVLRLTNIGYSEEFSQVRKLKYLKRISARSCNLSNIKWIGKKDCLEELKLSSNKRLVDLDALSGFKLLSILDLNSCSISNLYFLKEKCLKQLNLDNNPIEMNSWDWLRKMKSLKFLSIQKTNIDDVEVNGSTISGLESLFKELNNLEYLDLSGNAEIRNLSFLRYLPKLEVFKCAGISVDSIENISELKYLKYLDISNCKKISQIDSLKKLGNLKRLNISGCIIEDLRPLGYLPSLEVGVNSSPEDMGLSIDPGVNEKTCSYNKELLTIFRKKNPEMTLDTCAYVRSEHYDKEFPPDTLKGKVVYKWNKNRARYIAFLGLFLLPTILAFDSNRHALLRWKDNIVEYIFAILIPL